MKKFILSLFFVIFALFNVCGEDLLHPVIRDDIDEDIRIIEEAFIRYSRYDELVERGFDIHKLDFMTTENEIYYYAEPFFAYNEEKGWLPIDNHHQLFYTSEKGYHLNSGGYHRSVYFSDEYGTKKELLKKGYIENETMFYYPSNGEKDWRVGEWKWHNGLSIAYFKPNYAYADITYRYGNKQTYDNIYTVETEKSLMITPKAVYDGLKDWDYFPRKDNLIINLDGNSGGNENAAVSFSENIKNTKYKKIIVIIGDTNSAGEEITSFLKKDKRVILIGRNTNGMIVNYAGGYFKSNIASGNLPDKKNKNDIAPEGIGILPDIWANNTYDIFKNLWQITKDYDLSFKDFGKSFNFANRKEYEEILDRHNKTIEEMRKERN